MLEIQVSTGEGGDQVATFPLGRDARWLIGRSSGCDIRVSGDTCVSKEHAEIARVGDTLELRRTKGANPIVADGKPLETLVLIDGSRFAIGNTRFEVKETAIGEIASAHVETEIIDSWAVLAASLPDTSDAKETDASPTLRMPSAAKTGNPSLRLLEQLSKLLGMATSGRALANGILKMACERLKVERGVLASAEPDDRFEILAAVGFGSPTPLQKLISTTVIRTIIERRQAVVIEDTGASSDGVAKAESIQRNKIRSVACAPALDGQGNLCALLYFDNQFSSSSLTHADAEFLIWLGHTYCVLADNLAMHKRLQKEVEVVRRSVPGGPRIVAESKAIKQVFERAAKVAKKDVAVLILGESGSGKELVANHIHQESERKSKPFVVRNCAAISKELFESEMFGHMKGAFTGAIADKVGAFEQAHGGTLFLDEIGDLNFDNQAKLLRAIDAKEIQVVGGKIRRVDVRLVCATNVNLEQAMQAKSFREDLYFRIGVVKIVVPPLRERKDDILPLAHYFVERHSNGTKTLSPEATDWLQAHEWRGNVRELEGTIREAVALSEQSIIGADDLNVSSHYGKLSLGANTLAEVERRHITAILTKVHGNKTEAAKVLGIARSTLVLKLKEMGDK